MVFEVDSWMLPDDKKHHCVWGLIVTGGLVDRGLSRLERSLTRDFWLVSLTNCLDILSVLQGNSVSTESMH